MVGGAARKSEVNPVVYRIVPNREVYPMPLSPVTPGLKIPSYRRHRPTGQAVVTLSGRDIYLGPHGTKASKAEYDRLIGEWLACGRTLPRSQSDLTIAELCAAYLSWAKTYYRRDGRPTGQIEVVKLTIRRLRENYGPTLVAEFGPLKLEAHQMRLASTKLSRNTVNEQIASIRRMFRWAVNKEMVPVAIYQALATVPGLRKGRSPAREPRPIRPVADNVIDATLPKLPPVVADMVRVQRLTGCRPQEVCLIRPCDIDRTNDVWAYKPEGHKMEHLGRERVVFIGPKAQAVLLPYLLRDSQAYCFAPTESERQRNEKRRQQRQSPVTPSQARRKAKRNPKRTAGDCYTSDSFRRAIERAVAAINAERAAAAKAEGRDEYEKLPAWKPNQLRHTLATEVRRQFGLEAAQVVLGHAEADTTQIYAERDYGKAADAMRRIG